MSGGHRTCSTAACLLVVIAGAFGAADGSRSQGFRVKAESSNPTISPRTLHLFDLTPRQRTRLTLAVYRSRYNTDLRSADDLLAEPFVVSAYQAAGFIDRHRREYVAADVARPARHSSWPARKTVYYSVVFDLFKTEPGAARAARASRLERRGTPAGPQLGAGLTVSETLSSHILIFGISLQRGTVLMNITSECRNCPPGTIPNDLRTFLITQIAQAEAHGLPK